MIKVLITLQMLIIHLLETILEINIKIIHRHFRLKGLRIRLAFVYLGIVFIVSSFFMFLPLLDLRYLMLVFSKGQSQGMPLIF